MTSKQLELARHALGFPNKKNESYRNRYCIGKGGDGYEDWRDMVVKGLALERKSDILGGDSMFHLTLQGALLARGPKEHLSREDTQRLRQMENQKAKK